MPALGPTSVSALGAPLLCLLVPALVGLCREVSLAEVLETRDSLLSTGAYGRAALWQVAALLALSGAVWARWGRRERATRSVALVPLVFLVLVPISSCGAVGVYRAKVGTSFASSPASVSADDAAPLAALLPAYVEVSGVGCADSAATRTYTTSSKSGTQTHVERRTPIAADCDALRAGDAPAHIVAEVPIHTEAQGTWRGLLFPVAVAGLEAFPQVPYTTSPQALFLADDSPRGLLWVGCTIAALSFALPLVIFAVLVFDIAPRLRRRPAQQPRASTPRL